MSGFYTEADYENSIIELFQTWDIGMSTHQIWSVTFVVHYTKRIAISTAQTESENVGGCYC